MAATRRSASSSETPDGLVSLSLSAFFFRFGRCVLACRCGSLLGFR